MLTKRIAFWHLIRVLIFLGLNKNLALKLRANKSMQKKGALSAVSALVLSTVVYRVCAFVLDKLCEKALNL